MDLKNTTRAARLAGLALLLLATAYLASCSLDKALVMRPAGSKPHAASQKDLIAEGAKLWKDPKMSSGGDVSCNTCHINFSTLNPSFGQPYPHKVEMVESKTGMTSTDAEQMVQFCLLMPMGKEKPLAWDSRELAALTAYTLEYQKEFIKAKATK